LKVVVLDTDEKPENPTEAAEALADNGARNKVLVAVGADGAPKADGRDVAGPLPNFEPGGSKEAAGGPKRGVCGGGGAICFALVEDAVVAPIACSNDGFQPGRRDLTIRRDLIAAPPLSKDIVKPDDDAATGLGGANGLLDWGPSAAGLFSGWGLLKYSSTKFCNCV